MPKDGKHGNPNSQKAVDAIQKGIFRNTTKLPETNSSHLAGGRNAPKGNSSEPTPATERWIMADPRNLCV